MEILSKPQIGAATLAGLYFLFPPLSSGGTWGQYVTHSEFAQSRTAPPTRFRTGVTKHPEAFALQPSPARQATQTAGPVAIPVVDPHTVFGSALASCDKLAEASEAPALPGSRGEVKLDRC
jgi:hypothetical protein